jgi:hypothetical protein
MGKVECPWFPVDEVLTLFGNNTGSGRAAYRNFVEEGLEQGRKEELAGGGLVRIPGIGYAVARGERIAKDKNLNLVI